MNFAILFVAGEREPIERFVEGVLADIAADERDATSVPGVVYRSVPHSLQSLLDLRDQIWEQREALGPGRVINTVGIKEGESKVLVGTPNSHDVLPVQRALDAQYGSGWVSVTPFEARLTPHLEVGRSAAVPPRR